MGHEVRWTQDVRAVSCQLWWKQGNHGGKYLLLKVIGYCGKSLTWRNLVKVKLRSKLKINSTATILKPTSAFLGITFQSYYSSLVWSFIAYALNIHCKHEFYKGKAANPSAELIVLASHTVFEWKTTLFYFAL